MIPHNAALALAGAAGIVGIAAWSLWTSRINQFFFFGRTLPRDLGALPAAGQITQRYKRRILAGLGASLAVFAALRIDAELSLLTCFTLVWFLQTVVFYVAFARAHREAGTVFSAGQNAAMAAEAPAQREISIPLLGAKVSARSRPSTILLPIVTAAVVWLAAMAVMRMRFAALADAVGAHGGSELLGFGAGILCAGTLLSLLMRYSARYRTPMAQCVLRSMLLLEWIGVLAMAASAAVVPMHLMITRTMARAVMFPALAFALGYAVYSQARAKQFAPSPVEQNGDEFWRWGLFYKNPADPALFIQARNGPGYTLNFGKVLAWPIAAMVCGYLVLLAVLGFHHR